MPDSNAANVEEKTDRELLLGVHAMVAAMRASYLRVLRDRMKDRDTIQRHERRIENMEHQLAILTAALPGVRNWQPNAADLRPSEDTVADLAELDLQDEDLA